MIGLHAVFVYAVEGTQVNRGAYSSAFSTAYDQGGGADISCLVDQVAIRHGRTDATSQPEPSACTIDLTTDPEYPLPDLVDVGASIVVTTSLGDAQATRFSGRITDVGLGWDEAGEATPNAGVGQVIAVGTMADLGRRTVGDEPFPQENDWERVSRVAALAGLPLDPFQNDPGQVQIRPRDIDAQPALDVMRAVAVSAGGMLWAARSGALRYMDAGHRRTVAYGLVLDACDVLVTPTWTRNTAGLTNDVSIGYGTGDSGGGEQPRYAAQDPFSQAKWGHYAFTTGTELANLADAQAMGDLLLTRNNRPVWILSALPVDVEALDQADTLKLLGLDVNDLINLTGLPPIGVAPTELPSWVEGWTETLAWGVHDIQLIVSDFCRTSWPTRWNDPVGDTWDAPPRANMTWDEAACWGPIPGIGRWDDTPPFTRWDTVPASVTWDGWNERGADIPWVD